MSRQPSRQASLACLRLTGLLERLILIHLALVYLLGQAGVAWGWQAAAPLWLGGLLTLSVAGWIIGGFRLAVLVSLLSGAFVVGNLTLHRVYAPDFPAHHLRQLALPQKVVLEGWLFQEPERGPGRGRLYLEAQRVCFETQRICKDEQFRPATGKVLITVRHLQDRWQYGEVLRLSLKLRVPRNFQTPGSFDYAGYLARRGIYLTAFVWDDKNIEKVGLTGTELRHRIENIRRPVGAFFDTHLPTIPAAILRALIIGDKSRLDPELRDSFTRVGVAHVLAISGLHIGLVATLAYGAWWWLLARSQYVLLIWSVPKLAALFTLPVVLLYAGLAGGSVSTLRAVIMVAVFLTALLLDQKEEVFRSLALAALMVSLIWPGAIFDVSFQLSFVAVLAIFLGLHRFRAWWDNRDETRAVHLPPWRRRLRRWATLYGLVSLSATVGTLPLVATYFHTVPLVGFAANLLVVPFLGSAAVVLGLVTTVLVFIHTGAATLVVWCAGAVVSLGVWVVEAIAVLPLAAVHFVTPTLFELILFYTLCASLLFFSHFQPPWLRRVFFSCLFSLVLFDSLYWITQRYFQTELRVSFLDVGQGDAAVVEFPGSHVMVIDAGGFTSQTFDSGRAIIAPFLWQRKIGRIDTLVLSHPNLDHYGGLEFLAKYFGVNSFWFNGEEQPDSRRFKRLMTTLQENGIQTRTLCRDTSDREIGGVQVHILHPPCGQTGLDTNDASLVLRLSHGEVDILFSGDIERAGEGSLLATPVQLESEILKVPHHGSRSSSTLPFLESVSPQVAIASLGYQNRFRFPAPEVVDRYERQGVAFLRTDQAGTITVRSDGKSYRVETFLP
ncbi:MAG: DNA internalization-related competence protein ComEC/Rec2 [Desulfurellaceae bacterium]|nr:DNA internalization-related competence protein ComEC/Rec2 [Desulfurellaceae bacterium]